MKSAGNSPKTWNPKVHVYVAHSMSLVVSTLTTCLHAEGIPEKNKHRPGDVSAKAPCPSGAGLGPRSHMSWAAEPSGEGHAPLPSPGPSASSHLWLLSPHPAFLSFDCPLVPRAPSTHCSPGAPEHNSAPCCPAPLPSAHLYTRTCTHTHSHTHDPFTSESETEARGNQSDQRPKASQGLCLCPK